MAPHTSNASYPFKKTISAEAYALIVSGKRWTPEPGTKQAADFAEKLHATFPVEITETTLAGVACKVVVPKRAAPHKQDRVLSVCMAEALRPIPDRPLKALPSQR